MTKFQLSRPLSTDARERALHLLPVLQVDPFDRVSPDDISLSVSVSWIDEPITPATGWSIRQPYPNQLYFVGGSNECHLGHFVTLPERHGDGEVIYHWKIGGVSKRTHVVHRIALAFFSGGGRTYSMDVANWWPQSEFASHEHPTPEIGRNRVSRLRRQGFSPARDVHVEEAIRDGCCYLDIHEALSLPAITLNDCWTIETYGGEQALDCLEALR